MGLDVSDDRSSKQEVVFGGRVVYDMAWSLTAECAGERCRAVGKADIYVDG